MLQTRISDWCRLIKEYFTISIPSVGFEVLMAARMKMVVFWVVVPCSLVEVY
jgi:hypothetical protein